LTGGVSPVRAWCGIGIVFLLCLTASLDFLEVMTANYRERPDPWGVAQQEERLAALRAELGAPAVIGYYSDVPFARNAGQAVFFSALYTMAPHLLAAERVSPRPEMVLGNFHERPDLVLLEQQHGLKLLKDYGRGVMLFRQEKK
jgi:hypothetical protein